MYFTLFSSGLRILGIWEKILQSMDWVWDLGSDPSVCEAIYVG